MSLMVIWGPGEGQLPITIPGGGRENALVLDGPVMQSGEEKGPSPSGLPRVVASASVPSS